MVMFFFFLVPISLSLITFSLSLKSFVGLECNSESFDEKSSDIFLMEVFELHDELFEQAIVSEGDDNPFQNKFFL